MVCETLEGCAFSLFCAAAKVLKPSDPNDLLLGMDSPAIPRWSISEQMGTPMCNFASPSLPRKPLGEAKANQQKGQAPHQSKLKPPPSAEQHPSPAPLTPGFDQTELWSHWESSAGSEDLDPVEFDAAAPTPENVKKEFEALSEEVWAYWEDQMASGTTGAARRLGLGGADALVDAAVPLLVSAAAGVRRARMEGPSAERPRVPQAYPTRVVALIAAASLGFALLAHALAVLESSGKASGPASPSPSPIQVARRR